MNTPLPLTAPSAGTHRPQMRALYGQLATHLGFAAEKLPTLVFDQPGLASAKATFNMQARRITIGQTCEREFVQSGAYPFQLTVAHELTHAVLYEAGYGATGHADTFLAVYGLVLGKIGIALVELEMERCATQNWPADVPPSLRRLHLRRARHVLSHLETYGQQQSPWPLLSEAKDALAYARQHFYGGSVWWTDRWTDYLTDHGKRGAANLTPAVKRGAGGVVSVLAVWLFRYPLMSRRGPMRSRYDTCLMNLTRPRRR